MKTIVVVDYDPEWPSVFEELSTRMWPAVEEIAISIEHVGSTSVPGLAAKPVIDMSVVVGSRADVPRAIEALGALGYVHRGDLGVEDREAFAQPPELPKHHLYVCLAGSVALLNHLTVRDHLRSHPEVARRYGELKKQLAERYRDDIDRYVDGKTDLIIDILRGGGLTEEQLRTIERANRAEDTR